MKRAQSFAAMIAAILSGICADAWSAEAEFKVGVKKSTEDHDRKVDQAAISSNEQAIAKLQTLIKRYQGHRQEPILLTRLGDIYQQTAQIHFRVAHGRAHQRKSSIDLSAYRKHMSRSIETFNLLIGKYPRHEQIELAYFMRGKAFEEIEDKKSATRDYLHLVQHFPEAPETTSAYMSLAQFAIDGNEHERAISYLKKVEERPENPHYSFALFKMGWSYYNLKQIPLALSYIERHIDWYRDQASKHGLTNSDNAILENSLLDLALFYFDGFERKQANYTTENAYAYLRKWEKGPTLGRMLLRYSKLLRAHDHQADLVAWKDLVVKDLPKLPEAFDIVIVAFDNQLNRRQYEKIVITARDMVTLYEANRSNIREIESYDRAQKLLLDTAKQLQALTIKNKGATQVSYLSTTLAGIYDTFTKIVDSSDPRIPGVHYNLAETLFEIKQFSDATVHYRWVVENAKAKGAVVDLKTASLKAIASRYEVLRAEKLIPTEVKARAIPKSDPSKLHAGISEWVEWIDTHGMKYPKDESFDNFAFEANRALYTQGHLLRSTERLQEFAEKNPKSKFAIPSASLVVDSVVATEDWERTRKLALRLASISDWKTSAFGSRLFQLAADSSYKLMETAQKAEKTDEVLEQAEEFIKKYASSPRLEDALFLAANASLKKNEAKTAELYYSRLIERFPRSENTAAALQARAALAEQRYDWGASARDRLSLLALPKSKLSSKERLQMRTRALYLEWLSGDMKRLHAATKNPLLCNDAEKDDLARDCARYRLLSTLQSPKPANPTEEELKKAFHQALHSDKELRPLWALQALRLDTHERALNFPDRLLLTRLISSGFEDQDPLVQFTLLSDLQQEIPRAFERNRLAIKKYSGLKASEKSIKHRVELIQEMEQAATRAAKLPYARIQAEVLGEIAQLYIDFSSSLQGMTAPEGMSGDDLAAYQEMIRKLVFPFEEKGQTIRRKAFEIASQSAIERESFDRVAQAFFTDNPSQAKALQPEVRLERRWELELASLPRLFEETKAQKEILSAWKAAVGSKNWALAFHLLHEGRESKLLDKATQGVLKSIALSSVGARAEALGELDRVGELLTEEGRTHAMLILLSHYSQSLSKDKSKNLVRKLEHLAPEKRISKLLDDDDEAALVALAAAWSSAEITDANRKELLADTKGARQKDVSQWARKTLDEIEKARALASEQEKKKSG